MAAKVAKVVMVVRPVTDPVCDPPSGRHCCQGWRPVLVPRLVIGAVRGILAIT